MLLRHIRPFNDESFIGYVFRLSEANFYHNSQWLFDLLGIQKGIKSYCISKDKFKAIGVSKVPEEWFSEVSIKHENYHLTDKMFVWLKRQRVKVCPDCLEEIEYARKLWEMPTVTVCVKHRAQLVDECPSCKKKITWKRKKFFHCNCGQDLRNIKPRPLNTFQDIGYWVRIYEKYGQLPTKMNFKGNCLDNLDLNIMNEIVLRTANQIQRLTTPNGKLLNYLSLDKITTGISTAYNVYYDWPNNFNRFLGQYKSNQFLKQPRYKDNYREYHMLISKLNQYLGAKRLEKIPA